MKRNKRERQGDNPKKACPPQAINEAGEMEAEDEALVKQLLRGFDQMDLTIMHPEPPPLYELEQFVAGHKQKLRKQATLEWILFLVIAVVVIGGNMLLAVSSFAAFIAIQGALFVSVIVFVLRFWRKARKKVKSGHA